MTTMPSPACLAAAADERVSGLPIEIQIERFLAGETNGEGVLERLYGPIADEPIPERFTTLIRRCRLRLVAG